MIDLEQLEDERTEAQTDKADLFDFYHDNWDKLIAELRAHREPAVKPNEFFSRRIMSP
jgi:hypothetical protein